MLDVLLTLVTKMLLSTAALNPIATNQQSARQFPRWLLFTLAAVFVAAAAFAIAFLLSNSIRLLGS